MQHTLKFGFGILITPIAILLSKSMICFISFKNAFPCHQFAINNHRTFDFRRERVPPFLVLSVWFKPWVHSWIWIKGAHTHTSNFPDKRKMGRKTQQYQCGYWPGSTWSVPDGKKTHTGRRHRSVSEKVSSFYSYAGWVVSLCSNEWGNVYKGAFHFAESHKNKWIAVLVFQGFDPLS